MLISGLLTISQVTDRAAPRRRRRRDKPVALQFVNTNFIYFVQTLVNYTYLCRLLIFTQHAPPLHNVFVDRRRQNKSKLFEWRQSFLIFHGSWLYSITAASSKYSAWASTQTCGLQLNPKSSFKLLVGSFTTVHIVFRLILKLFRTFSNFAN